MHHALVLSTFSLTFLVLTILSGTRGDPGSHPLGNSPDDIPLLQAQQESALNSDVEEENQFWKDVKGESAKKGWKDLHAGAWGKRAWLESPKNENSGKRSWGDLRNGWGKRSRQISQDSWGKRAWSDLKGGSWGKRDWNQFRGGWGKRDNYLTHDRMADFYDDLENPEEEEEQETDEDRLWEDNKRAWNNLKGQWGKRDWNNFRGSWGKRDPAWRNLKGLWGKRSLDSKWAKLQGSWGKRSISGGNGMKSGEIQN